MNVIIHELSVSVKNQTPDLKSITAKKLNINTLYIQSIEIKRRSLDARKKQDIRYRYSLILTLPDTIAESLIKQGLVQPYNPKQLNPIVFGEKRMTKRPVVIGAGPCGLFAAYTLAKNGFRPILIERGKPISERRKDVDALHRLGQFNAESNICFGEGGAGTFSDGKLTTRIKDPRGIDVLETFIACGADSSIRYIAKPHLGTSGMQKVIHQLTKKIISLGGEVQFNTRMDAIHIESDRLTGIRCSSSDISKEILTDTVILATGHSAGDVYRMLHSNKIPLEKKPCAVGFRIEHSREMIDQSQLGAFAGKYGLGAAEYSLTAKHNGRGVYSFCMCPGGVVVCSSARPQSLCINGMSDTERDMENSNSAIVATLHPSDTPEGPLGALDYIESVEKHAYQLSGGYCAPSQKVFDFFYGKTTQEFDIISPSFKPDIIKADLNQLFFSHINESIKSGLKAFDKRINGFISTGVLTGVETRTSSPVRINRTKTGESIRINGLYPAGEGAGYAGGIISAAVDGIKSAEAIMRAYHHD